MYLRHLSFIIPYVIGFNKGSGKGQNLGTKFCQMLFPKIDLTNVFYLHKKCICLKNEDLFQSDFALLFVILQQNHHFVTYILFYIQDKYTLK